MALHRGAGDRRRQRRTRRCADHDERDGSFHLQVGGVDIGTGADTAFIQIAAEVLGCAEDDIIVKSSDTDNTPFDYGAYALIDDLHQRDGGEEGRRGRQRAHPRVGVADARRTRGELGRRATARCTAKRPVKRLRSRTSATSQCMAMMIESISSARERTPRRRVRRRLPRAVRRRDRRRADGRIRGQPTRRRCRLRRRDQPRNGGGAGRGVPIT